jgi:hypothetical protein
MANASIKSYHDGSDIYATTITNGLHKKMLLISMKLYTASGYSIWKNLGKTKAIGYRPDGTTNLVNSKTVTSSSEYEYECTSIIKGKFASKVVQLPAGVSGTQNNFTQYCDFTYILCE